MTAQNKNLYETFANHISEYVQAHLDEEIIIDDLALRVGVSKYHLNRLFQATTGFQLGEFIQRRRLQKAYALLSAGNSSVIDASLAAGYESHSSFSRAFLKAFGCKPSDVKAGTKFEWKTPNTIKNPQKRDTSLQPELVVLPSRQLRGLYGAGFEKNSFSAVGNSLFSELGKRLHEVGLQESSSSPIGVSLDSPWQGDQDQSRFFIGIEGDGLPERLRLDEYVWQQGTWARFHHQGSYRLMWQTISRVYADWIVPEGIVMKDDAIIQVYLNNPNTTPEAELNTALYFPVLL